MIYSNHVKLQKVKWINLQTVFFKVAKYKRILGHSSIYVKFLGSKPKLECYNILKKRKKDRTGKRQKVDI